MPVGRLAKRCRSIGIQLCNPARSLCLASLLLLSSLSASGIHRVHHVFNQTSGLPVARFNSAAQDTEGFIWFLSAAGGLFRYDGREFRHWAEDKLPASLNIVYAGPNGEVLAGNETLYRILPNDEAEVVSGIDGKPFTAVRDAAFTGDGRLWVALSDVLYYRDQYGGWNLLPLDGFGTHKITDLSVSIDGSLDVALSDCVLEIKNDNSVRTIAKPDLRDGGFVSKVMAHPDGSFYFMEKYPRYGRIMQSQDGQITELLSIKVNLQNLVLRGTTVWASSDVDLFAFRPGESPEILRNNIDIPAAGFLMVDREGSLWSCTNKGIIQYPEPETVTWDERDGFPITAFIRLLKTDEGIWIHAWGYLSFLFSRSDNKWQLKLDQENPAWLCLDGKGTIWGHHDYSHFYRREGGRFIKLTPAARGDMHFNWSQGSDGSVWIPAAEGLWLTSLDGSPPRFLGNPLGDDVEVDSVFEDRKGTLWISSGNMICQTSAAAVRSGKRSDRSCETLTGTQEINNPVELEDGTLWAGSETGGIWRYAGAKWEQLPGYTKFPSRNALVDAAPSGGVWVYGDSLPVRAISRTDLPDGWQIVESISGWQGVPQAPISTMLEDTDGSLWLGTSSGLVRMPAAIRNIRPEPPSVKPAALLVNGERVGQRSSIQIPPGNNQVELQFAALTFRDRSLLRLQYRLNEGDEWVDLSDNDPMLRFHDLGASKYAVEMRASLDGVNWSGQAARIDFEVLPHWYVRWWAIVIFALLTVAVLYMGYRLRVSVLLGLERQRTRIAMDLHDEIGSGLGSIGILSSVASSGNVDEEKQHELTKRISDTASEIGSSLTDIVWSLRSDKATLESLAYYLKHRADNLFADGRTGFSTHFPDVWRKVNLSLPVRRNVLLIATESLHNAAKHARAENVTLEVEQAERGDWIMRIIDDGFGLKTGDDNGLGLGMQSMRRRAREIGAEIDWTKDNGHGTIVTLKFDPQAQERS